MVGERATIVAWAAWRLLGLAFLVMTAGLAASALGVAGDFYQHEIAGFSPELESVFAPVHLLIFGGIAVTGVGLLLGTQALRREGHTPIRMLTT